MVLVELEVRAARDAEGVCLLDHSPGIHHAEIGTDDVLDRDEPAAIRQVHEPEQGVRHLQVGEVHRSGARVSDEGGEREPQIGH